MPERSGSAETSGKVLRHGLARPVTTSFSTPVIVVVTMMVSRSGRAGTRAAPRAGSAYIAIPSSRDSPRGASAATSRRPARGPRWVAIRPLAADGIFRSAALATW